MSTDRGTAGGARFEEPTFRTSRRNFVAAFSTLASALVATAVLGKRAIAKDDPPGCNQDQPPSSNPNCAGDPNACFLAGTRIATPNGEVEIEKLRIGDRVLTASGEPKPIKWIGRNRYTRTASEAWRCDLTPIRVSSFALDGRAPHADLYLTPGHAIYLSGLLIPVQDLVNGFSITANRHSDALTLKYYHIDLENHDVVFAEGAPAETYLGNNHLAFDNGEDLRLYGAPVGTRQPFAPIVAYNGGRNELFSRLRSVVAPIYDVRDPRDVIRDQIASRAELMLAA